MIVRLGKENGKNSVSSHVRVVKVILSRGQIHPLPNEESTFTAFKKRDGLFDYGNGIGTGGTTRIKCLVLKNGHVIKIGRKVKHIEVQAQ
jgi:hypothetical protein